MLTGAVRHSNEGAIPSFVSVKAIIVVFLTILWGICLAYIVPSTDLMLSIEPPPSLPFEFRVYSSPLDVSTSSRPATFTWGRFNIEVYVGRRPRPRPRPRPHPMLTPVRDYASLSAGGKAIEAVTSPAYFPPSSSRYPGLFSWLGRRQRNLPTLALTDGMEPGQCWAFCGDAGQLGIQFAHAIRISHLTVGYQSKSSTTSAPKNLILWGLKPSYSELCATSGDVGGIGSPTPDFGSEYCGIRLLSGTYELSNSTLYQNITTNVHRDRYFDRVIVQIVGNWGSANFTCIYRIQIYGTV